MYRLNRKGEFNVPFGGGQRTPAPLWEDGLLMVASVALLNVNIICSDFKNILQNADEGDLVYCDPTYTVAHNNNGSRGSIAGGPEIHPPELQSGKPTRPFFEKHRSL
jgi:site-specific DNA-adenine methylase